MANELSLSGAVVAFTKANVPSVNITSPSIAPTVSGTVTMDNVQTVGTSEEAILLGDATVGGYWYVQKPESGLYFAVRRQHRSPLQTQIRAMCDSCASAHMG